MFKNQFDVLVEIPKGSLLKYEYDKNAQKMRLDRILHGSNVYPGDYGFIANTLELDGDPIDVLILISQPTFPGCLVKVRIIGGLDMIDDNEVDRKLLAVADNDPVHANITDIKQLSAWQKHHIQDFFANYKNVENKVVQVKNWIDRATSLQLIAECQQRFREQTKK